VNLRGGYLPKIAGRPSRVVRDAPVPRQLFVEFCQDGVTFAPAVGDGDTVAFGAPLAWAQAAGGKIALPAPAAGRVSVEPALEGRAGGIALNVASAEIRPVGPRHAPERTTAGVMRCALAARGIWPLIWSSKTRGMPHRGGARTLSCRTPRVLCGGSRPLHGQRRPAGDLLPCPASTPPGEGPGRAGAGHAAARAQGGTQVRCAV